MSYKPKFNEDRTFGVEIECYQPRDMSRQELAGEIARRTGIQITAEGYSRRTRNYWKIITDATVMGGVEIVSPILAGVIGLEQIEIICNALEQIGCRVDRSTGLHVHHDVTDYAKQHYVNLGALYIKLEGALDTIMPPSRRSGNPMIRSVRGNGCVDVEAVQRRIDELRRCRNPEEVVNKINAGMNRYHKLNLTNFTGRGTVEFRQHSGTIEAEKIIAWVKLTQNIVERAYEATTIRAQGMDNFDIIIRFCPDRKTKAFYRKRQQHFMGKGE